MNVTENVIWAWSNFLKVGFSTTLIQRKLDSWLQAVIFNYLDNKLKISSWMTSTLINANIAWYINCFKLGIVTYKFVWSLYIKLLKNWLIVFIQDLHYENFSKSSKSLNVIYIYFHVCVKCSQILYFLRQKSFGCFY